MAQARMQNVGWALPTKVYGFFAVMWSLWWAVPTLLLLLSLVGCGPSGDPPADDDSPPKVNGNGKKINGPKKKKVKVPPSIDLGPPPKVYPVELSEEHAKTCKVGQKDMMPAFALADLDGKQHTISELKQSKLTVVLFFSTESQWQRESQNALQYLRFEANKNRPGVRYLGVNVGQSASVVKDVVTKRKVAFPILLDTKKQFFNQVATDILPRVYLLDEQGRIVWFAIRFQPPDTLDKLKAAIEFVLNDAKKE